MAEHRGLRRELESALSWGQSQQIHTRCKTWYPETKSKQGHNQYTIQDNGYLPGVRGGIGHRDKD